MAKWKRLFVQSGVQAAIGAILLVHVATPASAQAQSGQASISITHRLNYVAVQRNPWAAGASIEQGDEEEIRPPSINHSLPTTGFNPYQAIASFFDISLPSIAFAEMGGHLRGDAVLRMGYRVSGGSLDIHYPAEVELTMQRAEPARTDEDVVVNTRFSPGLRRLGVMAPRATCGGEDSRFVSCRLSEQVLRVVEITDQPRFSTSFPTASAYATFEYDLEASAYIEVGAVRVGSSCYICARAAYRFPRRGRHDLVRVTPSGIEIMGLDPIPLFDQTIRVGPGNVTVSYPRLEARNVRRGPDGLSLIAEDAQPLIHFSAAIDRLFPFIGPFLTNDIGPIGYSILGMAGGPRLGLYQDFRLNVAPTVTLHFSRAVMHRVGNGWNRTTVIGPVPIGQQIRWRPQPLSGMPIEIQPVYDLGARFSNRTGLSLGYQIEFGGLRLTAGGYQAGPIPLGTVTNNALVKLEAFCCDGDFDVGFDPIRPAPIQVQVQVALGDVADLEDRRPVVPGLRQQRGTSDPGTSARALGDRIGPNLGNRGPRIPPTATTPGGLRPSVPQRPSFTPQRPSAPLRPADLEGWQSVVSLLPLSPYLEDSRGDRLYLSVARRSLEAAGCRLSERQCRERFGPGLTSTPPQTEVIGGEIVDVSTTDADPRTPLPRDAPRSRAD